MTTLLEFRFAVLGALLWPAIAVAGPAEDLAQGEVAYRRGDVRGAIESLRRAADSGLPKAQVFLGNILDASDQDAEAARYFALAAAQGDPDGAFALAGMHSAGEGVALDQAKARGLMEQAAATGHREATIALALACLKGGLDMGEAERQSATCAGWLGKAGDKGHQPSLERLAEAYRKGELGLPKDAQLAEATDAKLRAVLKTPEKARPASRRRAPPKPSGGG